MAIEHKNKDGLARLLRSDVNAWNDWRAHNPGPVNISGTDLTDADLEGANLGDANLCGAKLLRAQLFMAYLAGANLEGANLRGAQLNTPYLGAANFTHADLTEANLRGADLSKAKLTGAKLIGANLSGANIPNADLSGAELHGADLTSANLRGSDLTDADLYRVVLVGTDLSDSDLRKSRVYGASVWDTDTTWAKQTDLIVTPREQAMVTVDNLKLAQFIYLLLENEEVRHIIDAITSKVVLILGRFTEERKNVLDALRNELRTRDYTPVLFDFEKPASRDLTETVSTLAHMAKFVIADITDARSIPQELQKIIPNLPSVPVRPIILENQFEYAMFKDFGGYLSVLPPYRYRDADDLLKSLESQVIGPALTRAKDIEERRKAFEQELANR